MRAVAQLKYQASSIMHHASRNGLPKTSDLLGIEIDRQVARLELLDAQLGCIQQRLTLSGKVNALLVQRNGAVKGQITHLELEHKLL
jgi:hypothetical protein